MLEESLEHLTQSYPHVQQIHGEKILSISGKAGNLNITTNKSSFQAKIVVIAIGAGNPFTIEGLESFVMPHQKAAPEKNRIQLKNIDNLDEEDFNVLEESFLD